MENTLKVAPGQQGIGIRIIGWQSIRINFFSVFLGNQIKGFIDHGQILKAQEIHLQQPHGLHIFHEVLGDHLAVVVALQRHQLIKGPGTDHHPRRMDTKGFISAFNSSGHVHPAANAGILFIFISKFRGR